MPIAPSTPPTIADVPDAPSRTDPSTFSVKADATLAAWQPNVDETNTAIAWENLTAQQVYDNAVEADASATASQVSAAASQVSANSSQTSADDSEGSAVQSANSAATAAADFTATSSTSLLIGNGSKVFAIETGKGFVIGQIVKAASSADPANEMAGEITAASSGSITVLVTQIGGSGTFSDWSMSINSVTLNDLAANASEGWSGSKISTELALKANLDSAALTGEPTAPNNMTGDNSSKIANTAYVKQEIDSIPASGAFVKIATIDAAAASSIDFVNVFSSAYDYYVVFGSISGSAGGGDILCQFHSDTSGTRFTSATYNTRFIENLSQSTVSSQTSVQLSPTVNNTSDYYFNAEFFNPSDSSNQSLISLKGRNARQSTAGMINLTGVNSSISAIYGFSLIPQSGTFDGSVTVFGVNT